MQTPQLTFLTHRVENWKLKCLGSLIHLASFCHLVLSQIFSGKQHTDHSNSW